MVAELLAPLCRFRRDEAAAGLQRNDEVDKGGDAKGL